jgi:hypothetical protein
VITISRAPGASVIALTVDGTLVGTTDPIEVGWSNPVFTFGAMYRQGDTSGSNVWDYVNINAPVPEPSALALLASGLLGLLCYAWRKRR